MSDVAYLCPKCGSSSLDYSPLVGGEAKCRACGWRGRQEDMAAMPFDHMYGSREGIGLALHNDFRKIFTGDFAKKLVTFLVRWGFVKAEKDEKGAVLIDTSVVLPYINAVAQASMKAIIEQRDEEETSDDA